MLDNSVFTKDCRDDAELAVCLMLLKNVPEDKEDVFAILHNAAARMDEDDVLTSVDKVALALVNCIDEDARILDLNKPAKDVLADITSFRAELYTMDSQMLVIPHFNYEIASNVCIAAEELVYASRHGQRIDEWKAELNDQLEMMGIETEQPVDDEKRQRLDDLVKAAEEFFTYPEGFETPNKSRNTEAR